MVQALAFIHCVAQSTYCLNQMDPEIGVPVACGTFE